LTCAGVELGGTKCVALLARGPDEVLNRETVPTTSPEETLDALAAILARWQFDALGVASFGPVDLDKSSATYGHITSTPKPGWAGTDVLGRLRAAATVPAAFDTDVNGAALAEMRWGSGRGFMDFAYITVGTGVGVGLVVNGLPTRGFAHSELGHIRPVRIPGDDWPGACSFHGDCVEGLASGTALKARLGSRHVGDIAPDDPVFETVAFALAQLCHAIVCAACPQRIAIGGGVTDRQPHLVERVQRMLVESLGSYMRLPREDYVVAPELGAQAGPMGSIALAMDAASAR